MLDKPSGLYFYTSEHNDGHEDRFCRDANYNPDEIRSTTPHEMGDSGNLFTPETIALVDRACRKKLSGVTADYGAITPWRCWGFSVSISR
jgi:hypothetical protein